MVNPLYRPPPEKAFDKGKNSLHFSQIFSLESALAFCEKDNSNREKRNFKRGGGTVRNDVSVHRVVKTSKGRGQYIESHCHAFFHYIYSLGGHTRVRVGEEEFQTAEGSLVLVPPETEHAIVSQDTSRCLDLKFSCGEPLRTRICGLPRLIPQLGERESGILRSVFEEAVGQEADYDEIINIRLYELLLLLLRRQRGGADRSWQSSALVSVPSDSRIRQALELIERRLDQPLRVSDVAEACGYHRNYFRSVFKEHMGITPSGYINLRRISRAKELMMYSELNISQISQQLGFQSIHYFSRLFKKTAGCSPSAYLARVKEDRPINVLRNENTPPGEFELPLQSGAAPETELPPRRE